MENILLDKLNYWIFILLMMLGLWAMVSKNNLIKKIMGMSIFQAAVILFYVSIGAKQSGADIPIYRHDIIHPKDHGEAHGVVEKSHDSQRPAEIVIHHGATVGDNDSGHADATRKLPLAESHTESRSNMVEEAHYPALDHSSHELIANTINPDDYDNPLPHVLMLTAIVVGVATLGVALSLVQRIYRLFGSIEENEVIAAVEKETSDEYMMKSIQSASTENPSSHA